MNIRSRVAAWLRRRRRVRAAKKRAPLREFVYLDDVSVFSLIASRLGPVAAEFTDIETASLQSEIEATGGVGAPPFKAEAKSRLQSTRGRESQVLRKSIVQTTFKELYELEQSRLLLRPAEPDEERPNLADAAGLEVWAAKSGSPWTVSSDRLTRGQLVEVEVELDPEPIFQMSTVMSTMLDIARDAPEIAQTGGYEQLGQIESVGRVLEKLLAGLIPVRGRALDYAAVDVGGTQQLVHKDILAKTDRMETSRPVNIVGVAEEALFWKDIRRVLFAGSPYRILCRVGRGGLQPSWTPVKLTDVFRDIVPEVAESLALLSRHPVTGGLGSGDSNFLYRDALVGALVAYGRDLAASHGHEADEADLAVRAAGACEGAEASEDVIARRRRFAVVTSALENQFGFASDPVARAHLRTAAVIDAGAGSGAGGSRIGSAAMVDGADELFLDVELVAIYW